MRTTKILLSIGCLGLSLSLACWGVQAQTGTVFVTGMRSPEKIIYAPHFGYFFVSEAGAPGAANSGRISIVTNDGTRTTLIDGLPSGPAPPENAPSGPSALWIDGSNRLFIAIGSGNETIPGPAPGSEIPNPNPNARIFSSVLELKFPESGFPGRRGFSLTSNDLARLADGETVYVGRATLKLVANFPDFTPLPRPDVPNNVRPSNPFGIVLDSNKLYVADAAQNAIRTVDLNNNSIGTLFTYPARSNPLPIGPPFIDPVPDSLRLFGRRLLVTFLTGFPFPAGLADVRQYDLDTGQDSQLLGGLTTAIDSLPVNEGGLCASIYTLEFSTNMLANAPGRLQRFDSPGGPSTVISNSLISPTSMARHPASSDLLVTEIFTGRIIRFDLP
ncbi:MAG: ScyD/ScyE family protein [Acidobacteria bacterium]|nr:ScyD/ScyE family protein [Acidobacteriota bacterium]